MRLKHILYLVFPILALSFFYFPATFYFWSFHPMDWSDVARLQVSVLGMVFCSFSILLAYWTIDSIK
jgi:hypothetical protein